MRKLGAWVVANLGVAALLAPWLWYSLFGAVTWSTQTHYTALQLGVWAKACYLPLTLCLGETVNPLNFPVVLPAFIGFGAAMASGIVVAISPAGEALPSCSSSRSPSSARRRWGSPRSARST